MRPYGQWRGSNLSGTAERSQPTLRFATFHLRLPLRGRRLGGGASGISPSPTVTGRIGSVTTEQCEQCGFDGSDWSDVRALEAVAELPTRWASAVLGLTSRDVHRRPVAEMWSIAEYADHVREVLFGMRFLVDVAVSRPGTDLGPSPDSRFDPAPRPIDVEIALDGIAREATSLRESLSELPAGAWASTVVLDGTDVDPHWIARHAVHDANHHLLDVERLRNAL